MLLYAELNRIKIMPLKNISLLFLCQTAFWTITIVGVTLASLIGLQLAPKESLATLPIAVLTLGNIVTTLPLSIIMQRYSRKLGFSLGAVFCIAGGFIACYSIVIQHFWLFCIANILLGIAQGSAMYYRLAATDGVAPQQHGKAIAWVMAGGILAAIIAPSISLWSKDLLLPTLFAGAYAVVAGIGFILLALCLALSNTPNTTNSTATKTNGGRPIATIIRQPIFITAMLNIACGHGVMILIMVSTPLAIMACGYSISDSAHVIQWHVLGMFIPSFFSGKLIDRFGSENIGLLGVGVLLTANIIALSGISLPHFYISLALLGVGWNFIYTSGSTLLTQSHKSEERGKTQGVSELIASIVAAIAAFSSGLLLNTLGWDAINWIVIPLLLLTAIATWRHKKTRQTV